MKSLWIAEFLGWHLGDGCISINKSYHEYALTGDLTEEYQFYKDVIYPTFYTLFKNKLKKNPKLKKYNSVGVCGIYVFDKNFVNFLQENFDLSSGKKINIKVPKILKTREQKKCFLRGLFDTDGSIFFCRSNVKTKKPSIYNYFHYKPKIKLATISKQLIEEVHTILTSLGYAPRLYKPRKQRSRENYIYSVVLDLKQDTLKWITDIGFKNVKHQTKVEIWKRYGFCPPYTKLKQRFKILKGELNPLTFYSK